mgnify:CR=1 FL=1|tara:strand:+ start:744 stop:950 length:207 start_codon:yes stop_codon:yes gene_type:complete
MKKERLTLTQIKEQLDVWIDNVNFDLTQEWCEDKSTMFIQLQNLLTIKSNIENIQNTGGQIFQSSISE